MTSDWHCNNTAPGLLYTTAAACSSQKLMVIFQFGPHSAMGGFVPRIINVVTSNLTSQQRDVCLCM